MVWAWMRGYEMKVVDSDESKCEDGIFEEHNEPIHVNGIIKP